MIQLSEKIGVPTERKDISVSHQIPSARSSVDPAMVGDLKIPRTRPRRTAIGKKVTRF